MSGAELLQQIGENWCLTVVRPDAPLSRDEVTSRLGRVMAEPVEWSGSMDPFYDIDFDRQPLRLPYLLAAPSLSSTTWVVVEPYGIEGSRTEVQAVLSVAARTFALVINENAWTYLAAEGGEVTTWSDLQLEELPDDKDPLLQALSRIERDSGVLWQEDWFGARRWLVQSEPLQIVDA